jgi:hypothetical protein
MARYVTREFGIETTHLIDTEKVDAAVKFGAPYRRVDGRGVCGKDLVDGVVMPDGYKVKCRVCRKIDEMQANGNLPRG